MVQLTPQSSKTSPTGSHPENAPAHALASRYLSAPALRILAKPDVSLWQHSIEVLTLGKHLCDRLNLSNRLRAKALLACALHDIGKANEDFQAYITGKKKKSFPHALVSFPFVLIAEQSMNQANGWDLHNDLLASAAVLSHHSPLQPTLYRDYEQAPSLTEHLQNLIAALWEYLKHYGVQGLPDPSRLIAQVQQLLQQLSFKELLDNNLANVTVRQKLQSLPPMEFAAVKAVLHLADWLASAGILEISGLFLHYGRQHIEHFTRSLTLRNFQQQAAQQTTDTLWLRAPTGTGKTEALLLWAGNATRILYLLPTQATANAMYRRLQAIYGDEAVSLVHGRSNFLIHLLSEEEPPLEKQLFGSVFAKPITVATLDQYLLGHLHGRHWEERRTLARSATVILDEIHAYEPYTLGLLAAAFEQEPPKKVAFASATLPTSLMELFPSGTLIEAEFPLWKRSRHQLRFEGSPIEEGLPLAMEYARQNKTVLIVANTVQTAQNLYDQLRETHGWDRVMLLHSRFAFRDRRRKEDAISHPAPGTIAVTTQIVEVSLDISYDILLTELAPLDAMVQRMGRVNRRGEQSAAPVHIYTTVDKGSQHIYGKEILAYSAELLRQLPDIPTDRDLAIATEQLYEHIIHHTPRWHEQFDSGKAALQEVQQILGCYTIELSDKDLRKLFSTRRGMISIDVLPECYLDQAVTWKEQKQGWRLPELLVPVPAYWLTAPAAFYDEPSLRCIVTTLPYSTDHGLSLPQAAEATDQFFV